MECSATLQQPHLSGPRRSAADTPTMRLASGGRGAKLVPTRQMHPWTFILPGARVVGVQGLHDKREKS